MQLVIDANVVFACIISRDKALDTVFDLYDNNVLLLSPSLILDEVERNTGKITKSSGLTKEEVSSFLSNLFPEFIKHVPEPEYEKFLPEAKRISPHLKDAPYFAVSLANEKAPLWSREPRLKRQRHVKVFSDEEEVREYFGLKEP